MFHSVACFTRRWTACRYVFSFSGYLVCAAPILQTLNSDASADKSFGVGAATQSFVTNKQLLTKGADATERIMASLD